MWKIELLREVGAVAEEDGAHAGVDEPELVVGDVDRAHVGEAEVPAQVGLGEREDEAAARGVDVQRNTQAALGLDRERAAR